MQLSERMLNKDYIKVCKIILNPNYGFDEGAKKVAEGYLRHDFEEYSHVWDKIFNDILNYKYVISLPMRLKTEIILESRFHNYKDKYGEWIYYSDL